MKKSSLMCAPLIALVVAVGLGANSQALAQDAKEILSQNPNLKSVTEIPVNFSTLHIEQCRNVVHVKQFPADVVAANLAGITNNHICIYAEADMGFKSYEKDYGKKRYFFFVLHPETPRVWRVYEAEGRASKGRNAPWLLAEFDQTGKRLARPASLPDTNAAGGGTVQTGTSPHPIFRGNRHLEPYINAYGWHRPTEVIAKLCSVYGELLPNSSDQADHGCYDYVGKDGNVYRVAYDYGHSQGKNHADTISLVGKDANGNINIILLRDFGGNGRAIVDNTGISAGGAKAADDDKSLAEEPPVSSPPQAGNPVVDAAKKAVDDLLKRLGR